jgi:hypothetical protein
VKQHVPARSRIARRLLGASAALLLALAQTRTAAAHGGVTGPQDFIQDNGVLLFLVATVLIGAGVLAWVTLSPQEGDADVGEEAEEASEGSAAGEGVLAGRLAAESDDGVRAADDPETVVTPAVTPGGSRTSR